jgi:hypothetical protein
MLKTNLARPIASFNGVSEYLLPTGQIFEVSKIAGDGVVLVKLLGRGDAPVALGLMTEDEALEWLTDYLSTAE